MTKHEQMQVKVNAFVDTGIGELISALSEVDGLRTLESCQGDPITGEFAFVIFTMGDWRKAGEFLFDRLLAGMSPDLRSIASLRLQAYDVMMARGSIDIDPHGLPLFTQYVQKLVATVAGRPAMAGDAHSNTIADGIGAARALCVPVVSVPPVGERCVTPPQWVLADGHIALTGAA